MNDDNILKGDLSGFNLSELTAKTNSIGARIASQQEESMRSIQRTFDEKGRKELLREEREKKSIELMEKLVELGEKNPEALMNINTLIQNSTIQNLQNNYDNATGIQNISSNTGLSAEEFDILITDMRELFSLLDEETHVEAEEMIAAIDKEVNAEKPKKGILKASIKYLMGIAEKVIVNPVVMVAHNGFQQFAQEKAPQVIEGLQKIGSHLGLF